MKLQLIFLFALLFGFHVEAAPIRFDARFDYLATQFNAAAQTASTTAEDNYRLYFRTGGIDFLGQVHADLKYRFRWNFNFPAASTVTGSTVANNTRDRLNDSIEMAFLEHRLSDHILLTGGKYPSFMGGREAQYSSAQLYLVSNANIGPYGNDFFYSGFKFEYVTDTQSLAIHVANNKKDITTGTGNKFSQNKGYTGLVYKGQFFEQKIEPIISYHTVSPGSELKEDHYALGFKITHQDWILEPDVLMNVFKNPTLPENEDRITSGILALTYLSGKWKTKFRHYTSVLRVNPGIETKTEYDGNSIAFEYSPYSENIFRYHFALNFIRERPEFDDLQTRNELVFGMYIQADFLKQL